MANKAKHAFGSLERVDENIASGVLDAYDILFVKDAEGKPYVGWVDKDGNKVVVSDDEEIATLESQIATKASAEEVNAKIGELETALGEVAKAAYAHEKVKYEFTDVPAGTLVDIRDDEIRVCCPEDSVWTKQNVGTGGDANCYYATFKTYAPSNDAVGYIEHLNGQVDSEVLTDLKTDAYGRKYQPTWLALARYDETTNTWAYYGKNSSKEHYIGYDYQIDWFNADGVMIASDRIRINLSNEECHSSIEPYYVGEIMKSVDEKIEEKIVDMNPAIEIVEF